MSEAAAYPMALNVAEIFVDHSYQRVCDVARARTMAATWDRRLAGIVEVSDRGGSAMPRYAVIDGQHRWAAAGFLKDPPTLVANVHEGLTIADEAALFDKLNRQRKQPSPWDHWRARRAAGDNAVLAIERTAADHGFEVTDRVREGSLWCISTLEKITASAGGLDLLRSVLTVLSAAWGPQRSAYEAPIVHGLAMTLYTFADRCDADRMIAALAEIPPQRIRLQASTMRDGGTPGSLAKLAAVAIANQYNRKAVGGRLTWPANWKGVLPKAPRAPKTAAAATPDVASHIDPVSGRELNPRRSPNHSGAHVATQVKARAGGRTEASGVRRSSLNAPVLDEIVSEHSRPRTVPDALPPEHPETDQYGDAIAAMEGQTVAAIAASLGVPERSVRRVQADLGIASVTG